MGRRQRLEDKERRRRIPSEREGSKAEGRDAVAKCWKVWIPRRWDNRRGFALFSGVAFLSMILLPLSSPSTATSGKLLQHGVQQLPRPAVHIREDDLDAAEQDLLVCSVGGCRGQGLFVDLFEVKLESLTGQAAERYCQEHRQARHINWKSAFRICQRVDCSRYASYGAGGAHPIFCSSHKLPEHRNLITRMCEGVLDDAQAQICSKVASFGSRSDGRKRFCGNHRREGDVNLRAIHCEMEGCCTQASFGDPQLSPKRKMRFCKAHAPPEYVNIKNRACSHKGCGKQAWKGLKSSAGGAGSALFCAKHAVGAGMQNVLRKQCPYVGSSGEQCMLIGSFNGPSDSGARWCRKHKAPTHSDTMHRKCASKGCKSQPTFGVAGSMTASHCAKHKNDTHIDIFHRRCQYAEGCSRRGKPGLNGKSFMCEVHRRDVPESAARAILGTVTGATANETARIH